MSRAGLIAALAAVALSLGGCGFTPLYATPSVVQGLSRIAIAAPPGRVGYLLRENLDDALGRDTTAPAAYRLEMTLAETRGPRGLTRTDVADYYDIDLTIHYSLIAIETGKVVSTGSVASQVSYDDSGQAYADIAAAQDADARIAADAARRIEIKIAAWMARRTPG